jgi:hypothetical protein
MAGERQELMAASPSLWEQAMLLPRFAEYFFSLPVRYYPPKMRNQLGMYILYGRYRLRSLGRKNIG